MSDTNTHDDAQLQDLLTFLRFASISTDSEFKSDVRDCGQWLHAKLTGMGLSSEIHDTPGHPVVLAKNEHVEGRPTVLIYGHYDVQPVDPLELWATPPFEPRVENGIIWARGSTDNKGQLLGHVLGLEETLRADGALPVNVTCLFEGEEEIGSPNLKPFLIEHKEELACDIVLISDTGMVAPGVPTFTYGLRGIACMEVKLTGPKGDLHSGMVGGAVANPATEIARLVATLHDDKGKVAIEGFYDDVKPLENWEREMWGKLEHNDASLLEVTGSPELFGEEGYTAVERCWARPTAEVNGIGGGYQGEGSKTVIASSAFAKLSFRLVPDQDPDKILDLAEAHLRKYCSSGVRIEIERGHSGSAYLADPHSTFGKAAQQALQESMGREPALIREGGSIPIVSDFKDVLGADTLLLGFALPDSNCHAPDENFPVANFKACIALNQKVLKAFSGIK